MKTKKTKRPKSQQRIKSHDLISTVPRFASFPAGPRAARAFSDALAAKNLDQIFFPERERLNALSGYNSAARHPLHPDHVSVSRGVLASAPLSTALEKLRELQRERVADFEKQIQRHPMMCWLQSQVPFRELKKSFGRLQNLGAHASYRHPYSYYSLLRVVATNVPAFIAAPDSFRPRDPSKKSIRKTLDHINKLQEDMDERYVRRAQPLEQMELDHCLWGFREELNERLMRSNNRTHVKRRDSELSHFREFNIQVARGLEAAFDVASPILVTHIARLVGSKQDDRVILSHIREI